MPYFNPRTSCEVRPRWLSKLSWKTTFQSTHLLRGATTLSFTTPPRSIYFNPRTSCEVRQAPANQLTLLRDFNPRTSCEVRPEAMRKLRQEINISIHAPLARCDYIRVIIIQLNLISIHAPLARCDLIVPPARGRLHISIHAPLARCDDKQAL